VITSRKTNLGEQSEARRLYLTPRKVLKTVGSFFCLFFGLSTPMSAQNLDDAPANVLHHPGWNYGGQLSGGSTVVQVSAPTFVTANRPISDVAVLLHVGRVLTREHGRGWICGTFEWDFSVIPVENFWALGSHYAGGFEIFGPRWNFTHKSRRVVLYAGLTGGMLFSPRNFSPSDTSQMNFTAAFDVGAHLFHRPRRSFDVAARIQHVSNAYSGRSNPGVPLSLHLTLGYSWY